jgi:hypothetical protein
LLLLLLKASMIVLLYNHSPTTTVSAMAAFGYCARCQTMHTIPTTDAAKRHARILRDKLESTGRLDFDTAGGSATDDGLLDVSCLHKVRGKMFGVLVAEDTVTGEEVVFKAFAGKIRSYGWNLEGWVDSIVVPEEIPRFVELRDEVSNVMLEMETYDMDDDTDGNKQQSEWDSLKSRRQQLSREALAVMRREQRVVNFHGESSSLSEIFLNENRPGKQMPVGTGECCATKLVAAAASSSSNSSSSSVTSNNLRLTGIAEFFLGKSKNRRVDDGIFYDSCQDRCQKVLGFMLCGLTDQ